MSGLTFLLHFVFSVLAPILPSVLILRFFYRLDLRPDPWRVLRMSFGLGFLLVLPNSAAGWLLAKLRPDFADPFLAALYSALVMAALLEESGKFLVLWFYSARQRAFDEPMDGMIHGVFVAVGFATLENLRHIGDGPLITAIVRGMTAIPAHACFGVIQGYYLGQWRFRDRSPLVVLGGLTAAIGCHALYDYPLLALRNLGAEGQVRVGAWPGWIWRYGLSAAFVLTLAIVCGWAWHLVQRLRREQVILRREEILRAYSDYGSRSC